MERRIETHVFLSLLETRMRDSDTRDSIVKELHPNIKDTIDRHKEDDQDDISRIVSRCIKFPECGLESLLFNVWRYERDSGPMAEVFQAVSGVLENDPTLNSQNLRLHGLFQALVPMNVGEMALRTSYRTSLPKTTVGMENGEPAGLFAIIERLLELPSPDGSEPPLLRFAKNVADIVGPGDASERLKQWIGETAAELGLNLDEADPMPEKIAVENRKVHLLVHLKPDPSNRNNKVEECALDVYEWDPSESIRPVYSNGKCEKDRLLEMIDDIVDSKFSEHDDIDTVEFILPCEWIHLNIYGWKQMQPHGFETRLVDDYRLLVRLDRYRFGDGKSVRRRIRNRWRKRWNDFRSFAASFSCDRHAHCEFDHESYDAHTTSGSIVDDDDKVCLLMTFMPQDAPEFGYAILNTGIPVAVWCRKFGHGRKEHSTVKERLFQLVSEGKIDDLPDRVRKSCRKPEGEKKLWDNVTLLWDDPNKVPKELKKKPNLKLH